MMVFNPRLAVDVVTVLVATLPLLYLIECVLTIYTNRALSAKAPVI
jgi:hypothetical protein